MTSRLGVYELLGTLGEGGMGLVYRVRHLQLGGEYALKTIPLDSDPEALARTRREGEAMAQLSGHPHVVSVHSLFEDQGQLCLVMELCPGGDLQDRLSRGPLPPAVAGQIVARLAEGLAAAHEVGILHRDLKPANVLFDAGGVPKLTDFGIARVADSQSLTQTGSLLGTPSYMAPEQAEGRRADARSDVYGLGAVLYQCLSGAPPFGPGPVLAVLNDVVNSPPPPLPPGVPSDLAALCLRALAKSPEDRPQSALEFRDGVQGDAEAGLRRALRVAAAVLGLLILVLATLLSSRLLSREDLEASASAASATPNTTSQPQATPIASPSASATPRESPHESSPWLLSLPPWPESPGPRTTTPQEVREISRRVARFPPLAPAAWRARGLRTHACPPPQGRIDLGDLPGPDKEFFARCFQDLEAHPGSLLCLRAASRGLGLAKVRVAAGVRGHDQMGLWLACRLLSAGSVAGFRRLRGGLVGQGIRELQDVATVQRGWRNPPTTETRAAWRRLGRFAQRTFATPHRGLLRLDPGERPPDPSATKRIMAELTTRSWDLLLVLEAAARGEGPDAMPTSAAGDRYEKEVIQEAAKALRGDFNAVRFLGRRLHAGDMGCQRDQVTGPLLLYLVIQESPRRRNHALYNLGHGSTKESVEGGLTLEKSYTKEELACLVLCGGHSLSGAILKAQDPAAIPSKREAELLFLEAQARALDRAGLLGGEAVAYGPPPKLPATPPSPPHTDDRGICLQLRDWIPHSLVLRNFAREAAALPSLNPEERRDRAGKLRESNPLVAAQLLRSGLESNRFAAREFIDALVHSPVPDPALRARLIIACAFFGQPRSLRLFDSALEGLGPEWEDRAEAIRSSAARVYWEAEKLSEIQKSGMKILEGAPSLDEAWRRLRAFDAELARRPVLQRLSEWTAEPLLPGDPADRVRRAVRRLASRRRRVARALDAGPAQESPEHAREGALLRRAAKGEAQPLLELAELWGQEKRYLLARAVLVIALEGLPQEAWLAGASIADSLYLPKLGDCLRRIPRGATRELWQVFHRERELALMGAGLPSLADLDAWGVPR